jgi:hypothetical protein
MHIYRFPIISIMSIIYIILYVQHSNTSFPVHLSLRRGSRESYQRKLLKVPAFLEEPVFPASPQLETPI